MTNKNKGKKPAKKAAKLAKKINPKKGKKETKKVRTKNVQPNPAEVAALMKEIETDGKFGREVKPPKKSSKEKKQAKENADFEKRAYAGLTEEEKFKAVIEDKQATSVPLTDDELKYVNETYFKPEGFVYDHNWKLHQVIDLQKFYPIKDFPKYEMRGDKSIVRRIDNKRIMSLKDGKYCLIANGGEEFAHPAPEELELGEISGNPPTIPTPAPEPPVKVKKTPKKGVDLGLPELPKKDFTFQKGDKVKFEVKKVPMTGIVMRVTRSHGNPYAEVVPDGKEMLRENCYFKMQSKLEHV